MLREASRAGFPEDGWQENSPLVSERVSSSQNTLERHKCTADLLALRKLLFTVEVQCLQDWSIADGEQVGSFKRFVVNTGPGRGHEDIARTPFEAHAIDD